MDANWVLLQSLVSRAGLELTNADLKRLWEAMHGLGIAMTQGAGEKVGAPVLERTRRARVTVDLQADGSVTLAIGA